MSGATRIRRRPADLARLREATAYGLVALGFAIEHDAKREAPVAGGHRSFMTGPRTKAGTPRIGGNLRRSIHTEGYLDGRRVVAGTAGSPTSGVDENGRAVPDYVPRHGIAVFIGTNCDYGAYVELGTSKMRERPYLRPAALANQADAERIVVAGARRHDPGIVR